jgi:hypothetical protein
VVEGRATVRLNKVDFQDGQPRPQEYGKCCHTQDDKHLRPAKHSLTVILEVSMVQQDHHEDGITLGKPTITRSTISLQHCPFLWCVNETFAGTVVLVP